MSEVTIAVIIAGTRQKLTITEALEAKRRISTALAAASVRCMGCGSTILPRPKCSQCGLSQ